MAKSRTYYVNKPDKLPLFSSPNNVNLSFDLCIYTMIVIISACIICVTILVNFRKVNYSRVGTLIGEDGFDSQSPESVTEYISKENIEYDYNDAEIISTSKGVEQVEETFLLGEILSAEIVTGNAKVDVKDSVNDFIKTDSIPRDDNIAIDKDITFDIDGKENITSSANFKPKNATMIITTTIEDEDEAEVTTFAEFELMPEIVFTTTTHKVEITTLGKLDTDADIKSTTAEIKDETEVKSFFDLESGNDLILTTTEATTVAIETTSIELDTTNVAITIIKIRDFGKVSYAESIDSQEKIFTIIDSKDEMELTTSGKSDNEADTMATTTEVKDESEVKSSLDLESGHEKFFTTFEVREAIETTAFSTTAKISYPTESYAEDSLETTFTNIKAKEKMVETTLGKANTDGGTMASTTEVSDRTEAITSLDFILEYDKILRTTESTEEVNDIMSTTTEINKEAEIMTSIAPRLEYEIIFTTTESKDEGEVTTFENLDAEYGTILYTTETSDETEVNHFFDLEFSPEKIFNTTEPTGEAIETTSSELDTKYVPMVTTESKEEVRLTAFDKSDIVDGTMASTTEVKYITEETSSLDFKSSNETIFTTTEATSDAKETTSLDFDTTDVTTVTTIKIIDPAKRTYVDSIDLHETFFTTTEPTDEAEATSFGESDIEYSAMTSTLETRAEVEITVPLETSTADVITTIKTEKDVTISSKVKSVDGTIISTTDSIIDSVENFFFDRDDEVAGEDNDRAV